MCIVFLIGLDHVPRTGRGGADPDSYFHPDKRVVLKWNEQGVPCDAWSVPFNRYIGCLVKRSDIFNPWYLWKYQPFSSLESAWRNLEVICIYKLNLLIVCLVI